MSESVLLLELSNPPKITKCAKDILEQYGQEKCLFLSSMGRYREGKSFLMSLLYQSDYQSEKIKDIFKVGFGDKSVTKGVFMTKTPIKRTIKGETLNVFFLDSQGLFATDVKKTDNLIVSFLLSISPICIFNVNSRLNSTDIDTLKFNLYLGVVDNENCIKTKESTMIITCRDRPVTHDMLLGKFNVAFRAEQKEKCKNLYTLLENFKRLEFSLFPEPNTSVMCEDFSSYYKDVGQSFLKAKDNLKTELENIFANYINDAISCSQNSINLSTVLHSLCQNDFVKKERSFQQLQELMTFQIEYNKLYQDFDDKTASIFNVDIERKNISKVKKDGNVFLQKFSTSAYFVYKDRRLMAINENDIIPLKETFLQKITTLLQNRIQVFESLINTFEENKNNLDEKLEKYIKERDETLKQIQVNFEDEIEKKRLEMNELQSKIDRQEIVMDSVKEQFEELQNEIQTLERDSKEINDNYQEKFELLNKTQSEKIEKYLIKLRNLEKQSKKERRRFYKLQRETLKEVEAMKKKKKAICVIS
ncbi:DgyrCDS14391 [Dimorphilus gyrociliatus]|uniref:DgyrCDS14391 n=1 Tax=Dimorphilus gyrociliatus TaxID=2664684 RepID=A0A7I8WDG2_9ANNE|nr:DgyrCDS14391 [Dimorphilus gyrociliatus]